MDSDLSSDIEEDTRLLNERSDNNEEEKEELSKLRQNVMLITILSLQCFSLCSDTLIAPFFPHIAMEKGLKDVYTGIVFSSYEFSRFLASPIAGSLLGKWSPKRMCMAGNIMTATACIIFGILNEVKDKYLFFGLCMTVRFTAGLGSAMLSVAATSILMKVSTYKSATIVGLMEIMQGAGFALGPVFGAVFYELTGYSAMFWILGSLMLLFLPIFILVVPKVEDSAKQRKNFLGLFLIPGSTLMFTNCLIMKLCGTTRTTGISNWITSQFGESPSYVGVWFAIWSGVYIVGCIIVSRVVNKGFVYQPLIAGFVLAIGPSLLIGPSPLFHGLFEKKSLWQPLLGMTFIHVLVSFMYIPPLQAVLDLAYVNGYNRDSVQTYGMVAGFINSALSLGSAIGPTVSGAITDALNFAWATTATGFLTLVMGIVTLIYWMYMRCTHQPLALEKDADVYEKLEEDETEKMPDDSNTQLVANACDKKMKSCLNDYGSITTVHLQQPDVVEGEGHIE